MIKVKNEVEIDFQIPRPMSFNDEPERLPSSAGVPAAIQPVEVAADVPHQEICLTPRESPGPCKGEREIPCWVRFCLSGNDR
jgi:hypothetical protein